MPDLPTLGQCSVRENTFWGVETEILEVVLHLDNLAYVAQDKVGHLLCARHVLVHTL